MEIKGKLIQKMNVENGTSARGAWCKQGFVIETLEQYPKKVYLSAFGENLVSSLSKFNIGTDVCCYVNVDSREFNGKWYTNLQAWKITSAYELPMNDEPKTITQQNIQDLPQNVQNFVKTLQQQPQTSKQIIPQEDFPF